MDYRHPQKSRLGPDFDKLTLTDLSDIYVVIEREACLGKIFKTELQDTKKDTKLQVLVLSFI